MNQLFRKMSASVLPPYPHVLFVILLNLSLHDNLILLSVKFFIKLVFR